MRPSPEQAASELLRRRRARSSLIGFAEEIQIPGAPLGEDSDIFAPVGSSVALHHRVLMEALERTILRRYGRLMVFMPPGSAKSTYSSVVASTWFMGKFPGSRVLLASYADDLAKKLGRRARSIVKQDVYRATFGAELSRDTSAADMWSLVFENGGAASEYMAGSFQSGVTGSRASLLICDDPVKGRAEADSPTVQRRTLEVWEDDLLTRLLPGAAIILIATRWSLEDLAGSLLPENYNGESGMIQCRDGMMWEVLNIPAESERADDPLGRPIGDGVGGVPGSMLWPEWFDEQHWTQYRRKERTWSALYQQRPRPEKGGQFQRHWFNRYDLGGHPRYMNRYVASDYAVTEADDGAVDFTEHGVAGLDENGQLWMLDWWSGQMEADKTTLELFKLVARWKVKRGFGETGVIRRAIEPIFKDMKRRSGQRNFSVEYLPHIGNKVAKCQSFRGMASAGRVWIPRCPWGDDLIDQLCVFPGRSVDDKVDVCSLFGMALEGLIDARIPLEPEERPEPVFGTWAYMMQDSDEGKPKKARVM